ncbi:MAG: C40 family peptidase [Treponema sp.]|jgi:probable lipoprotein NlpC|nr:C40 family peptidase [Treponema sp.]
MAKSLVIVWLAGFFFRISVLFAAPPLDTYVVAARIGGNSANPVREARNKLLAAADAYRGTPYRYGGVDRNGVDCSGLIYASFKDSLAVSVPRSTSALYSWTEKIGEDSLQPGDLVFFITTGPGISHAGIYTGEGRFIHSASEGPSTGVIYSSLDESYWRRTFAGAGRALPELSPQETPAPVRVGTVPPSGTGGAVPVADSPLSAGSGAEGRNAAASGTSGAPARTGAWENLKGKGFMVGFAFAPSWSGFMERNNPIRGITAQGRFAWKGVVLGQPLVPGFEVRPEWDDVLGVFRVPFTFSLGFDDNVRFFAGPAFSVGTPTMRLERGNRHYTGGNSWFGSAGLTLVPLSIPVSKGSLDLYGELAWQSYYGVAGTTPDWNADISASLRFSTGIRYTWEL